MNKILMISGVILLVAMAGAGGFWGGMTYQTRQAEQVRSNFEALRGAAPGGQIPGGGNRQFPGAGPGFAGGGGTTGIIKTIEGNVVTLSTPQDVTIVNLTEATGIEKTVTTTASDLEVGMRILVNGDAGPDGTITATRISIINENSFAPGYPPPAGLEP